MRPTADVASVTVFNDLPSQAVDGGIMVELGDLWAGECRRLLLGLHVRPPPSSASRRSPGSMRYVAVPALAEHAVTLPVSVNVVPGDQAAGRVPDPRVRTELLFQRAQDAKRRAAEAIAHGDAGRAEALLSAAGDTLAGVDDAERDVVLALASEIRAGFDRRAAKRALMQQAREARKRGRGR